MYNIMGSQAVVAHSVACCCEGASNTIVWYHTYVYSYIQ